MKIYAYVLGFGVLLCGTSLAQQTFQTINKDLPQINFCSGKENNNNNSYYGVGISYMETAKAYRRYDKPYVTSGSIENLERLENGQCQISMVQKDALVYYRAVKENSRLTIEQIATYYSEYAHLACGRHIKATSIEDLPSSTRVAIGNPGSGSYTTWMNIISNNKQLSSIAINDRIDNSSFRTLSKIQDENNEEANCVFFVAGLKSNFAIELDRQSENLRLLAVDASSILKIGFKKPNGAVETVYRAVSIPAGTYPNLQKSGFFSNGSISTVAVEAISVMDKNWADTNPQLSEKTSQSLLKIAGDYRRLQQAR